MSTDRLRLVIIIGSVREGRFGPTVANWFTGEANQHDHFEVDLVDLADFPLPVAPTANPAPEVAETLGKLVPRIEAADAYVIVTAEYNHGIPASLKSAIDWHFTQWQAKPIAFVSYGGLAGGLRAVEHLRQVFAELHAVTVRDTVSFHGAAYIFDEDGQPKDTSGCTTAAKVMLDQLAWWGTALRDARATHPYQA